MNAEPHPADFADTAGGHSTVSPLDVPIAVTFFQNFAAAKKLEELYTLRSLAERIKAVTAPEKARLPWLKLARFGNLKTDKGSLRHDGNLLTISGIEADYDSGQLPPENACEILAKQGVAALVYTSPSHTEDAPRWRVLCPLSTEMAADRRQPLLGRLNGLLGGIFSGESWTLSQSYYYGSVKSNPSHRVELVDGTAIDLHDELDEIWRGKPNTASAHRGAGEDLKSGPVDEAALLQQLVGGESYHLPKVRLLGLWARQGVPFMEARRRLVEAMQQVFPPDRDARWQTRFDDIDRCLRDIYGRQAHDDDAAGRGAGGAGQAAGDAPGPTDDPRPVGYSDDALALRFTDKYGATLRHVSVWGRWLEWRGSVWRTDDTHKIFDLSRGVCRAAAASCNSPKLAPVIASAKTVAAVERLAKADRRHAATIDQWDADPWLLNTPGGVVDLRTGKLRQHRAEDYMTKSTAVSPGGDCPQFLRFLHRVTGGDGTLQGYLQRVAGYALTGSIKEHALFFCFGTGANGKGVLINTLTALLADYAVVASIDVFTAAPSDRHPTDLAMLRGARLVTAQETEEGRRWAEARIKAMTGGDPVTARFMRQDFFTFEPTFKLVIAGNHRPGLRNIDEAIRRRFNLVPFAVKIPAAERDKDLPEKLKAEWPGILKWAIQGCLDWQRIGLASPAVVTKATDEYLEAEDAMAAWMSECCKVDPTLQTRSSVLFASWREWAEKAGEFSGSQKRFSQALQMRGFQLQHTNTGGAVTGIGFNMQRTRQTWND